MKKILFIGAALAIGGYLMWGKKNNTAPATLPNTLPGNVTADPYEKAHITALDNQFSLIVHNGVLYFDDKPGYFEQYIAQYGQKEMTVPVFETFAQNYPVQKSLSELFTA